MNLPSTIKNLACQAYKVMKLFVYSILTLVMAYTCVAIAPSFPEGVLSGAAGRVQHGISGESSKSISKSSLVYMQTWLREQLIDSYAWSKEVESNARKDGGIELNWTPSQRFADAEAFVASIGRIVHRLDAFAAISQVKRKLSFFHNDLYRAIRQLDLDKEGPDYRFPSSHDQAKRPGDVYANMAYMEHAYQLFLVKHGLSPRESPPTLTMANPRRK